MDKAGAKIPKPEMIKRALEKVNDNDYVVWLDADTILWDNPKWYQRQLRHRRNNSRRKVKDPSVMQVYVCLRKHPNLQFVDPIEMTKKGKSDQREMNRVPRGLSPKDWINKIIDIDGVQFKLFPVVL